MSENLNEDMLRPFDQILNSTLKEQKTKSDAKVVSQKKESIKRALSTIYAPEKVPGKPNNPASLHINLKNMKSDGHLVEVQNGDNKVKVATEPFVTMTKGYVSALVKTQEALKKTIYEQDNTIKKLKSRVQTLENKSPVIAESTNDFTLQREIKRLSNRITDLEKQLGKKNDR